MNSSKIKVIIAGIRPKNKQTAAYNRYLATEKILRALYKCTVVMPNRLNKRSRITTGVIARFHLLKALSLILLKVDNKKYNHIIFLKYTDPFLCLAIWLLAQFKGVKLAIERNEFPAVFINKQSNPIKLFLYKYCVLSWHYRLIDVLFLMTDELINFYSRYTKNNCIIQKFPMTVDFSRFKVEKQSLKNSYIFYAGSLSEQKDGVESLIHAFKKIINIDPQINLKIAGGTNDGMQGKRLHDLIKEAALEDRVELLGIISRDEIPGYLCAATMVVLPRPDSMQARGGFPTKLGEYLAAGRPVIVTRVGEIPKYLSDNEVFFISPDNIIGELSEKIQYVLSNYNEALQVAERGKGVAFKKFSLETNQKVFRAAFEKLFSRY